MNDTFDPSSPLDDWLAPEEGSVKSADPGGWSPTDSLDDWLAPQEGVVQTSESRMGDPSDSLDDWLTPGTEEAVMAPQRSVGGLKPGEFSEKDLVTNDAAFAIIKDYMTDRYGIQALEGESREDIVAKFLNNRRGNAAGNSVRALSEANWIYSNKDNTEKLARAGAAYKLFEDMSGLGGENVSWSEFGGGVADYVRTVILDPVNLASGFIGKALGGTAMKTTAKGANILVQRAVMDAAKKGATKTAQRQLAKGAVNKTLAAAADRLATEVTEFAGKIASTKGFQRLATSEGLREVAGTTAVDAIANVGTEFLYQKSLVETGVQEDINKYSVGIAAAASLVMGGVQAVRVAKRGLSDQALVSEVVQKTDPKVVAKELKTSLEDYFKATNNAPHSNSGWAQKLADGDELADKDTDFFAQMMFGIADEDGNSIFKGLTQIMQENGYYYVPRSDNDKVTNWIADFVADMSDEDARAIVKAYADGSGTVVKGLEDITAKELSDNFATKISKSGYMLKQMSDAAKRLNVDLDDLDVESFLREAMGLGVLKDPTISDKVADAMGNRVMSNISEGQNKMIRMLVSHPSTSMLNVVGWGSVSLMNTTSDMARAALYAGKGALQKAVGMSEQGASSLRIANSLIGANTNRMKLLLDPDMTAAAYLSAVSRSTGALEKLNGVLSGGVDMGRTVDDVFKLGRTGMMIQGKADEVIDVIQVGTFVKQQDVFTKSQEYVFQMDKNLRLTFGKSWDEFYRSPDAAKIMATKEYKELEASAVSKTLEATFSKSYKGRTPLGEVAGIIEDVRNTPGLGAMIPFGRFFNNTVDFMVQNGPLTGVMAKMAGKYQDKTYEELLIKSAIAGGIVTTFAARQQENRKQGLGMYQAVDPMTGEIVDRKYEYPISMFMAAGRIVSYLQQGEEPPKELVEQFSKDFGGAGLTRNLTKTSQEIGDFAYAIVSGNLEQMKESGSKVAGNLGAQVISGFTRFYEPVDEAIGLVAGTNMAAKDTRQGNKFIGDSLRYMDNTVELLTGNPGVTKVSAIEGVARPQSGKMLGVRADQMTDLARVMNLLEYPTFKENAKTSVAALAPEAANEYNRQFFNAASELARNLMADPDFRNKRLELQRYTWNKRIEGLKDAAKTGLGLHYTGPQSTLYEQLRISQKYKQKEIRDALGSMYDGRDLGDLSEQEVLFLDEWLANKEFRLELESID